MHNSLDYHGSTLGTPTHILLDVDPLWCEHWNAIHLGRKRNLVAKAKTTRTDEGRRLCTVSIHERGKKPATPAKRRRTPLSPKTAANPLPPSEVTMDLIDLALDLGHAVKRDKESGLYACRTCHGTFTVDCDDIRTRPCR